MLLMVKNVTATTGPEMTVAEVGHMVAPQMVLPRQQLGGRQAGRQQVTAQCPALLPAVNSLLPLTGSSIFPATTRDIAVQCLEAEAECEFTEEELTIVRRPGEKLGFGLRFEGGGRASETVRRLYIQCCSPQSPAARAACSWGGIVEGDQILSIAGQQVNKLTRLQCVKALKGRGFSLTRHSPHSHWVTDSPVSVNMRIRHYFANQLGQASSYDLHPISDKKINNLNKQTKEKTSQTSPKKPVRTSHKKAADEALARPRGSRLLSSQSLRVSSSVPSLGLAKGSVETEAKVSLSIT